MGVASLTSHDKANAYIDDDLRWGRVEVCVGGAYSTVCNDGSWGDTDTAVACKDLGFSEHGATIVTSGVFGLGNNSEFVGQVRCSGDEQKLLDCEHDGTVTNCENAAAVICQGKQSWCTVGCRPRHGV